jgi:hypothetical protein
MACTIGPMSADLLKQIGIIREAISFMNNRIGFIKQNGNFEKSGELKDRKLKHL